MSKSVKKNRSSDFIDHDISPNHEKLINPSKKNRTENVHSVDLLILEILFVQRRKIL